MTALAWRGLGKFGEEVVSKLLWCRVGRDRLMVNTR